MIVYSRKKYELVKKLNEYEVIELGGSEQLYDLTIEGFLHSRYAISMDGFLDIRNTLSMNVLANYLAYLNMILETETLFETSMYSYYANIINFNLKINFKDNYVLNSRKLIKLFMNQTINSNIEKMLHSRESSKMLLEKIKLNVFYNYNMTTRSRRTLGMELKLKDYIESNISLLEMNYEYLGNILINVQNYFLCDIILMRISKIGSKINGFFESTSMLNLLGLYPLVLHDDKELSLLDNQNIFDLEMYRI